jgi:transposase-like protein
MERRKFTREFKLEAVRLIKDRGVSYAQAEQDLAVHQSQLRSWVKAFADDQAARNANTAAWIAAIAAIIAAICAIISIAPIFYR